MNRGVKLALGIVAAVASLAWAFAGVDLPALVAATRAARPLWIFAAVASVVASLAAIVWRWWLLLDRPNRGVQARAPWAVLASATLAAQMANIVMPFRLGDGVRIVAASQTLGLGVARAASAAVIERLADVMALGVIAATLVVIGVAPAWARTALLRSSWMAALVIAVALVGVALVVWIGSRKVAALPSIGSLYWAVLGAIAVPMSSALTNLLVFRAFDLPVPASAALLLMVVLQVGTSIVTVPGGLGVSQLLTVKTLAIWQVPPADALAFSLVLFAVANAPKLLMLPVAMAAAARSTARVVEV